LRRGAGEYREWERAFQWMMNNELPLIDVHAVEVATPTDPAWHAVVSVLNVSATKQVFHALATVLGCSERRGIGEGGVVGSTLPGFRVVRSDPPAVLSLEGDHRFSVYALEFRIEPVDRARSRVLAETRAVFPGVLGKVYRTLVIDSRGHVIAVRRMLSLIKQAAEAP
jgi:hypothetical protein